MKKKITDIEGSFNLGYPTGRKLFKVSGGAWAGRKILLIKTSMNDIKFCCADAPYLNWSSLQTLADDSANLSFDAVIDENNDIYIIYSQITTTDLIIKKLTFTGGEWSVGSGVTIHDGNCFFPTVAIDANHRIWVAFCIYSAPNKTVYVKYSDDNGVTWGSGAADPGEQLSDPTQFVYPRLIATAGDIHVFYAFNGSYIYQRSRSLSGGDWSDEYAVATGSSYGSDFDIAVAEDGRIGITYSGMGGLKYREFDGNNWGAVVDLTTIPVSWPQLTYRNNVPVIVFLEPIGTSQTAIKCTRRQGGTFTTPAILDYYSNYLTSVMLFNTVTSEYADLTEASADSSSADVYHSESSCLLKEVGDQLLVGSDQRFRFLRFILSTPGVNGTVNFSYWDGNNWQAFTPSGGLWHLTDSNFGLILWTDYQAIPANWQKSLIDGQNRFWVKIEVTSSYSTGPVGSQITTISSLNGLIIRR